MVFIVGLTGGIASGKTTATRYFIQKSIQVVDADQIARDIVQPNSKALSSIQSHFGEAIIHANGGLNRKKLRDIIFNHNKEKKWLENLLHPMIREEIVLQLAQVTSPYGILVSPLLLETNQHALVHHILVIDAGEETQIARTLHRDHTSEEQTRNIIKAQLSREKRLASANDVVENNASIEHLYSQLERLHSTYLEMACGKHSY